MESLEDLRSGLVIDVDKEVLVWVVLSVRYWKIRAPTSSVISTGSQEERSPRVIRTKRTGRVNSLLEKSFFNI